MSHSAPRMTLPTQAVLRALLAEPSHAQYGLEICAQSGLASGTIHPILGRLESIEWIESHWEDVDPRQVGRPRRRYYRLTQRGAERARSAIKEAEDRARGLQLRMHPGLAEGGLA
jgi:PadR family transcriptional regulator, regulatory protein PadR